MLLIDRGILTNHETTVNARYATKKLGGGGGNCTPVQKSEPIAAPHASSVFSPDSEVLDRKNPSERVLKSLS